MECYEFWVGVGDCFVLSRGHVLRCTPSALCSGGCVRSSTRVALPHMSRRQSVAGSNLGFSRELANLFFEADVEGDREVTFGEFSSRIVPTKMLATSSKEEIRELFDSIDTDKSGKISMNELFLWTLKYAQEETGTGIDSVFRRYDKSGRGALTITEFCTAAEELGFGAAAHDVFIELDPDGSGQVSYSEMKIMLGQRLLSPIAKRFIRAMAFDAAQRAVEVDSTGWTLRPESKESIREQVLEKLKSCAPARASDLYRAMSGGTNFILGRHNFHLAMSRIGMPPNQEALEKELYDDIDGDGSGIIGDSEFVAWLAGGASRRARARKLTLRTGLLANAPKWTGEWDANRLRHALQLALIRAAIAPIDLIRGYAGDDASFSKQEFLSMLKRLVNDPGDLWETLRDVVIELFNTIAGSNKSVDVTEFQSWLQMGWMEAKRDATGSTIEGTGPLDERVVETAIEHSAAAALKVASSATTAVQRLQRSAVSSTRSAPTLIGKRHVEQLNSVMQPLLPRTWPAKEGDHSFARRWAYRPKACLVDKRPVPVPDPPLPPWRLTRARIEGRHFLVREESEGVRPLRRGEAARKRAVCFYQEHRPAPSWAPSPMHRTPPSRPLGQPGVFDARTSLPFAGVSRTVMTVQEVVMKDLADVRVADFLGRTKNTR